MAILRAVCNQPTVPAHLIAQLMISAAHLHNETSAIVVNQQLPQLAKLSKE